MHRSRDTAHVLHSAYSESVSWVAWPIGETSRASRNFVCGFCGGTGTNCEACELNFGAAQVIMQNGVCFARVPTRHSVTHCPSPSLPVTQNRINAFSWVYTVHNS